MAAVTDSGLMPGLWIDRLVRVLEWLGIMIGWLFQDDDGSQQPLGFFEKGSMRNFLPSEMLTRLI